jgi:uncharacterized membrane protein
MSVVVVLVVSLLLVVLAWLMPTVNRPTLPFGVRVPADHAADPVIVSARGGYRRWVAGAGGVLVAVAGLVALVVGSPFLAAMTAFGAFAAVFGVFAFGYARARHRILVGKQRQDWYAGRRQGVAVDTALRTEPQPVPWRWALPAVVVVVGTAVAGIVRYPVMPALLAMHRRADGTADRLVAKSVGAAFTPVFIQVGVSVLIVALTVLVFTSKPDIDAAAPVASSQRHRVFLTRMAKALFVLTALVDLALAVLAWVMWTDAGFGLLALVPVALGVATVVAVAVRTGQEGHRVPVAGDDPTSPVVHRDDDALWRGGLVYVNPDDPAVMVPKRFGVGWTVNFGNRLVWIGTIAIIGFVVAGIALLG